MKDLCERVCTCQSHSAHKLVGFEPFAPTAFFLRIAMAFAAARHEAPLPISRVARLGVAVVAVWAGLFAIKLALGFLVKQLAAFYVGHYDRRHLGRRRARLAAAAAVVAGAGASAAGHAGGHPPKKEE